VSLGQISLFTNPKTIQYFRGFFHRTEGSHYSIGLPMHRVTFLFHSASVRLILGMDKLIQIGPVTEHYEDSTKPALRYFHQATNSRSCFASKLENGGRRVALSSPRIMPIGMQFSQACRFHRCAGLTGVQVSQVCRSHRRVGLTGGRVGLIGMQLLQVCSSHRYAGLTGV
jgi:hypothetical protein